MSGDRACLPSLVFGVLVLVIPGCGSGGGKVDLVPPSDTARAALDAALDAWKNGQAKAIVKGSDRTVELADSTKTQRKLSSYQIVGPAPAAADDPNPRFNVKLKFEGSSNEEEATYIVVGKQPIWVFSQKDYQQIGGM